MIRAGLTLPKELCFGLCTYKAIKKLKTAYNAADDADWTEVTATGNRCYSVKCCATYALSQRNPPAQFSVVCGRHHEATADVKAVAVILFDREVFGRHGLWDAVFNKKRKVCESMHTIWTSMVAKMDEPLIVMQPPPQEWVLGVPEHDGNSLSSSSTTLPRGVRPHIESKFVPPRKTRGQGCPTEMLLRHLGMARDTRSAPPPYIETMELIFRFIFTDELLGWIAEYTNAKAREEVSKVTRTNSDGHSWKVEGPGEFKEQRCTTWSHDVTVGELLVYFGIIFKMGAIGHKRVCHYWNQRDGFVVESIRRAMTLPRFKQITANLSFAPLGTESGWAKISKVDAYIQSRCQLAMTITQFMTVDESMLMCLSHYCPWIVYMPRKPIKMGIKV